ncbi:MAG: helix-turn-helix domain-containing protein [Spirochaetales bacterium]|nr:helix-turn-helix domain-containing protein [Spirochaetales bacterium]
MHSVFGKNLLFYRKDSGMTQKELAEKVGVQQVTIANYERGTRFPGEDLIYSLARALSISVSLLFTDKSAPAGADKNVESFSLQKILKLLEHQDVSRATAYIRAWKQDSGLTLEETYTGIIIPVLKETGRLWESGVLSVSEEHLISLKMREIISVLADDETENRKLPSPAPRWIGLCAPSDHHDLVLFMLYELLRTEGWEAAFLGTDIPLRDLEDMIKSFKPDAITISCSMIIHKNGLESYLEHLETMNLSETVISLGGRGVDADLLQKFPSVLHCSETLKDGFKAIINGNKQM